MKRPKSRLRFRSPCEDWDSRPPARQGREVVWQVGSIASPRYHPTVAETMVQWLARDPVPCINAVRTCVTSLTEAGFEVPSWRVLTESTLALRADDGTRCIHQKFHDEGYWPGLSNPERA